ncbi:MAG: TonB-dependent receptor [Bacteroidales bacterium]|jgi:TonB-linked SusC/RagA family outer membrane protein|nr:TonB-dependent receptor [Bacteroidales bacterium]
MKPLKVFAAVLSLTLVSALSLFAQTRQVSGTVLDAQQQPVVGAAVMTSGLTGTITDSDGSFALNVPAGDVTLEVNCMGYEIQNVLVPAGTSTVRIILQEDSMLLEETVVVGYGTQKKVNLTGAITSVESRELENRSAHSLSIMLQGAVPGLNITTSSGSPGSTGSLNIRGYTSINGAAPLVLIDGAVGDINRVNPNDVESISVIKDAAAAAVYGARAAFGVILVTTKSGVESEGKTTVRYSGRFGWEEPTTSTDYETTGYWSVYTINKFRMASEGSNYVLYDDRDMMELLARVNDKTENPARPWVVDEVRNGKRRWTYYGNNDWWHKLYNDRHPVQQQSVSLSGGTKSIRYMVSGGFDKQVGIIKLSPDVFKKYNLRSKIDFDINKYMKFSNNTSFYTSNFKFVTADGNIQNAIVYSSAHGLPIFPFTNPDGSYVYRLAEGILNGSYAVGNGRHIVYSEGKAKNAQVRSDFSNTSELIIKPFDGLTVVGNFTYRLFQNRDMSRDVSFPYRTTPDAPMEYYDSGAGLDELTETVRTYNYYSANLYATYEKTFLDAHHLTLMAGSNYETRDMKYIKANGQHLLSEELNDLSLVGAASDGTVIMTVDGDQSEYALLGFFGRVNYDYKGKYLFEASGRYDGTSRFASGHRWGWFPSVSAGWRISEEPFFAPLKSTVNNLKFRASFGTLGNQEVADYAFFRAINVNDFAHYSFGETSSVAKYSNISAPNASDLTWETSEQYNLGVDFGMFKDRLQFTAEAYIRDTKGMLTDGIELPSVYGASVPKMNTADLRTKGYELSLSWRSQTVLAGRSLGYSVKGMLSQYDSEITKFENKDKILANYYVGQKLGEIWGFIADDLFQTDEEAAEYSSQVDLSYVNGKLPGGVWKAGDLKYIDLDGDGKISIGANSAIDPGDRKIIGNRLPKLQYGINLGLDYAGFDFSTFFQGTGNHHYYFEGTSFAFWGPFSQPMTTYLPKDFLSQCWDYNNTDAYFPRAVAYLAYNSKGQLARTNTRYLQNIRYLRWKNLTLGYTLPKKVIQKIGLDKVRVYFTGENLHYWSPLKAHSIYIDPEAANVSRSGSSSRAFYPWQKTYMFGVDITF